MPMQVRYPDVHVHITGEYPCYYDDEDYDVFSVESRESTGILEQVQDALRNGGVSEEEVAAYTKEATSRCYNHLMFTTMTWVCLHWEAPEYTIG